MFALCDAASRDRNKKKYMVVCYLGSWANYRQGEGKFLIEDIDPQLCTHLIYGFAKLGPNNEIAAYDPYLDLKENWGLGAFARFNNLKQKNPELTTILAIGGWNEGSTKYSNMAKQKSTRKTFINSCVAFLLKYDFDGLDLDWEYPANRGGAAEDKENFIHLLEEIKQDFKPDGLLVTAAVAAGKGTIDTAYNIPKMGELLDIINVMAYDFHGSWEKSTGHNAPLYARPDESEDQKILNVDYAINYWIQQGAPKEKITLGMGTYGRSFTLKSASENGLGATVTGKGTAGPITREPGMLGYNEICKSLTEGGWTVVFDEHHQAPYAYKDRQWVGYDDQKSIKIKVEYLKKLGLGGGMIWSLETDDFRGKCHGHKYPLLTIINDDLNGPSTRVTVEPDTKVTNGVRPTVAPTQPPQPETTKSDDGTVLTCTGEGTFRHPTNCEKFYTCTASGEGRYRINVFDCGPGTAFDEASKMCTFKHLVKDC